MVTKQIRASLLVGALALAGALSAHAAVIAQNLGSIITAGGSITSGNATYSNFVLNGSTIPASNILVNFTTTPTSSAITFTPTGGGWKTGTPDDSSQVQFDVAFATAVQSVGLDFSATASGGASASVGETVTDKLTSKLYSNQVFTDGAGGLPDSFTDSSTLSPSSTSLHILKSIDVAGSGSADITSVDNVYYTPEPASLSILALGVVPFLRRRRHA